MWAELLRDFYSAQTNDITPSDESGPAQNELELGMIARLCQLGRAEEATKLWEHVSAREVSCPTISQEENNDLSSASSNSGMKGSCKESKLPSPTTSETPQTRPHQHSSRAP